MRIFPPAKYDLDWFLVLSLVFVERSEDVAWWEGVEVVLSREIVLCQVGIDLVVRYLTSQW